MNILDKLRSAIRTSSDAIVISASMQEDMMSSAYAVFGRDVVQMSAHTARYTDGDTQSDYRIGTALMSLHKSLTELGEAGYGYVPVPFREQGCMNSPSDVGRRAIARQAQIDLAKAAFIETVSVLVGNFPDDARTYGYFRNLTGVDVRALSNSSTAASKIKAVLKGSK